MEILYILLFLGAINGIRIVGLIFIPNKLKINVTSWASEGITPDLNSGRWVMLSKPNKLSFYFTLAFGGRLDTKNRTFKKGGGPFFCNYITKEVTWNQLALPCKRKGEEHFIGLIIYNIFLLPFNLATNKARIK
ncbi:hypothetical protein ACOTVL_04070 [Aliarcobacter butzleri]